MAQSLSTTSTSETSWIQRYGITIASVLLGSLFLALMARVSIPLPFTPVPVSMQTFAIFIMAGLMGSRNAVLSVIAYVVEGTCGLPVFAGGMSNPFWMMDATAGYLVGFVAAAYITGKMIESFRNRSFLNILFAIAIGEMVILSLGTVWLSYFVGTQSAFVMGAAPFLIGDAMKVAAASCFLQGYSLLKK